RWSRHAVRRRRRRGPRCLSFQTAQVGTLGGGCVEAEVKRRALRLLDEGQTELLVFNLDNDYGWDDGLICGGRMKMLVDPVRCELDFGYYRRLLELITAGAGCTEAIVLD